MAKTLGKRVLVAGATGYLGKFAVQALKQAGYHVRGYWQINFYRSQKSGVCVYATENHVASLQ